MASSFLSSQQTSAEDGSSERVVLDRQNAPDGAVELRDALSAQGALTEIARAIVGRSSAREVAQVVVDAVRRLVPSDRSAVWTRLPERDALQLLAAGSTEVDLLGLRPGDVVPVDDGSFRSV